MDEIQIFQIGMLMNKITGGAGSPTPHPDHLMTIATSISFK
jgi:hypothetical protein